MLSKAIVIIYII